MDALIRYTKKVIMRIILTPFRLFPLKKNRVVLINDLSRNYSGNPKMVAEYLSDVYPDMFEIIIVVKDTHEHSYLLQKGMRVVKFNSFSYFFLCMTAAILLTNSGGLSYLPLKKSQYVINTWHGGGAYKKSGLDMYEDTPLFRKDLLLSANNTDVFLSTCKKFSEVFEKCMLIPKEAFWEIGMPRNDMLICADDKKREIIRENLGLKEGEKLILFAPTYRKPGDNYFKESISISYGVDCKRVCKALEKRFGGTWRFAFRFHPCVTNRDNLPEGNVMDFSEYGDMQELLLAADAMINDFSSSMWDFMLTGRPSFTFALDMEHYINTTEVYTPVESWPFSKAVNNDELEKNILSFDEKEYAAACERHYTQLGGCETGKATQLVCERIHEVCLN